MSNVNGIFTGNSRYATDFQSVVQRSVLIASLPKAQMETEKAALDQKASALRSLETVFRSLDAALASVEKATGPSSYSCFVSDGAVAKAAASPGALEGVYSFEVTALGSYTKTMAPDPNGTWLSKVADPASASFSPSFTSFTLRVSGEADVTVTGKTVNEVAASINGSGKPVRATVVNVGPPGDPDYRLSVESTKLGPVAISLTASEADNTVREFLSGIGLAGEAAAYTINGKTVTSDSRTVTLAPGLGIEMLGEGTASVTVSRSTSGIGSALSAFANAYNAANTELQKHRGQAGGALAGSSTIGILSRTLARIAGYSTSGPFTIPKELGLEVDKEGVMTFSAAVFSEAAEARFPDVATFLGSPTAGGFLKAAADELQSATEETGGVISGEQRIVEGQIDYQERRIAEEQTRIDALTERLNAQMAAADALIASLEQQVVYIKGMFDSMRSASETYS